MLRRWWSFWIGFLGIRIEGSQLEKFINMAASRGIPLYDLRREPSGRMSAKVRMDGFRSLRHVARKSGSRMRIESRYGLPFYASSLKRQRSLVIGVISFVLTILIMSTFVWDVEVNGNDRVDKQQLLQAAAEKGIRVGRWRPLIDVREAEQTIMGAVPGLEWVGIKAKGTRVVIEVQEKVLPKKPAVDGPCNIVATKGGVIQRLMVLVGEGKVAEGERVAKDQVLISGLIFQHKPAIRSQAEEKPEPPKLLDKVQARGEAWAKVSYDQWIEEPVVLEGTVPTGAVSEQWRIKWGNQEIIIKGPRSSPYPAGVEEVSMRTPSLWRNLGLPVEIIKTEYHELRAFRHERTAQEAMTAAQEKARQAVSGLLPPGARVLREMVLPQPAPPGMVKVKVSVETLEDIAHPQPIETGT
ncbi:sporulation protein YqfD [Heliobacterium undosum]|uniref:Sporulation protein YqfD n=1 Tax=Heliomicrobium undosum TaxID=121734 RepID=A0A845L2Q5_9FIRM|nr:sporulation protein YqfD [Heliomicrobium undosum]MZP28800.1 sporulation protein YqfD [Heliomicrobium undosum]